jgi:hypothetical protein
VSGEVVGDGCRPLLSAGALHGCWIGRNGMEWNGMERKGKERAEEEES